MTASSSIAYLQLWQGGHPCLHTFCSLAAETCLEMLKVSRTNKTQFKTIHIMCHHSSWSQSNFFLFPASWSWLMIKLPSSSVTDRLLNNIRETRSSPKKGPRFQKCSWHKQTDPIFVHLLLRYSIFWPFLGNLYTAVLARYINAQSKWRQLRSQGKSWVENVCLLAQCPACARNNTEGKKARQNLSRRSPYVSDVISGRLEQSTAAFFSRGPRRKEIYI